MSSPLLQRDALHWRHYSALAPSPLEWVNGDSQELSAGDAVKVRSVDSRPLAVSCSAAAGVGFFRHADGRLLPLLERL